MIRSKIYLYFMPSPTRQEIHALMEKYASFLNLKDRKILDVGIAGDPTLPGATSASEKYEWFGKGNYFKTIDNDPQTKPDYVGDIVATDFSDDYWDLVILDQTLEHVFDFMAALRECHRIIKPDGYFILGTPAIMYPYHPTDATPDYWRFSRDSYPRMLSAVGFTVMKEYHSENLDNALCQK